MSSAITCPATSQLTEDDLTTLSVVFQLLHDLN